MVAFIDDYRNGKTSTLPAVEPCNIEAEEKILGALILDPNAYSLVGKMLSPEMFYFTPHKEIYRAIVNISKKNQPTDLMGVSCWLQDRKKLDSVGGMVKLTQLMDQTVSSTNVDRFALLVAEKWARRELLHAGRDLADIARDQTWESSQLFEFVDRFYDRVAGLKTTFTPEDKQKKAYTRLVEQIKEIEQGELDPGLKTYKLNELARITGTTPRFLSGLYQKYLSSFEFEPSLSLAEFKEKYGSVTQDWYLHGFGPAGSVVLLHAHGGVGKTRLIYDWIYALATGQAWEGHHVTAPSRRCLLVQTDESQGDTLTALDQRGFTDEMPVRLITKWSAEHMAGLRKEIDAFRPEVILIDSLTSINRNAMFSENDTEYARPVLELRDLAQEFGCLIYLVHHSNSQNGSRGTKAITASVSHVFSLKRESDNASSTNPNRILCVDKSRCRAPGEYLLEFNQETGGWQFNGVNEKEGSNVSDDGGGAVKEQILAFLTENRNVKYEIRELTEILGGHKTTIQRATNSLANAGLVCRAKSTVPTGGKRPNVYWVAWEKMHDGEKCTPKNDASLTHFTDASFQNALPERVSEGGASKFAKTPEKSTEKNPENLQNACIFASKHTGQGFQKDASSENDASFSQTHLSDASFSQTHLSDASFSPAIGSQVIARAKTGEIVAGELTQLGIKWAVVVSDKGERCNVSLSSVKPRPGHFSPQELEDMLYFEVDRLGLSTPEVQTLSQDLNSDFVENLTPQQFLNLIYFLRKLDPA